MTGHVAVVITATRTRTRSSRHLFPHVMFLLLPVIASAVCRMLSYADSPVPFVSKVRSRVIGPAVSALVFSRLPSPGNLSLLIPTNHCLPIGRLLSSQIAITHASIKPQFTIKEVHICR